jgi:hypothetical protein
MLNKNKKLIRTGSREEGEVAISVPIYQRRCFQVANKRTNNFTFDRFSVAKHQKNFFRGGIKFHSPYSARNVIYYSKSPSPLSFKLMTSLTLLTVLHLFCTSITCRILCSPLLFE